VKIVKHSKTEYRVIAVPRSAVPEALLRQGVEVTIVLGGLQQGAVVVEARFWRAGRRVAYFIASGPYADYLNQLASQGVRGLVMYQIAPKGP